MFSCVATIPRTPARLQDSLASLKSLDTFINHFLKQLFIIQDDKIVFDLRERFLASRVSRR
jgi:hypothetical protein